MKIIEPSVELWKQSENVNAHVARCARICYRKETGNDEKLIEHLVKVHHWSMFRHKSVFAVGHADNQIILALRMYKECPYINFIKDDNSVYISTNSHFIFDLAEKTDYDSRVLYEFINCFYIAPDVFETFDVAREIMQYTFCIDTQISTSRELNRVSPNNISEQSTRYVYEDGTICRPWWMNETIAKEVNNNLYPRNFEPGDIENLKITEYVTSCASSFISYKRLVDKYNMLRQDARGVLPIDTATRCAYTYSVDEWRKIIDLRYYGTTGTPHPNAKLIAGMIRNKLIELGYDFRS